MSEHLKDIPEFFENSLGESLSTRTDQLGAFRELGPPDLCHIVKTNLKPGQKEVGSYHYVSGIDASSSASIAAYLNSLTYAIDDNAAWFGKGDWKIKGATYCCYNAFSRLDVRVEVKIPGGVESYCIDTHGQRQEASNQTWLETYLSACVRAILFADDGNYRIAGYRKLDPIPTVIAEARFLEATHSMFDKGWLLGSDPEVQTATVVKNHLSDALMKFFSYNFQFEPLLDLLERLYGKDPEIGALLAKAYIESNQEIKAVHLLYKTLQIAPTKYTVLHAQVDYLLSKNAFKEALKVAKFAVNCMPSEFLTWSKLAQVYIELGEYKTALLALNSCPMFTYSERDQHRMLPPAKTHLPVKLALIDSGLLEAELRDFESDPNLLRLPAAALHGTFLRAYALLTKLAARVGWDELLRARSDVFVMEEEYRKAKEVEETKRKSVTLEAIKDVQNRRLSALEGTQPKLSHEAIADNEGGEDEDKNEHTEEHTADNTEEHTDVQPAHAEDNNEVSPEENIGTDAPATTPHELNSSESANNADDAPDESKSLDNDMAEDSEDPIAEEHEDEPAAEPTSGSLHESADDSHEAETKENGLNSSEIEDNDSNLPSGAQTPSSTNTGEDKTIASSMSKNAKKNQKKKNKKKNKNKKSNQSAIDVSESDNVDEGLGIKQDALEVDSAISVPEKPQAKSESPTTEAIPVDKIDINSDEFAEIDIGSSEPVAAIVDESHVAEPKQEAPTMSSTASPALVEPTVEPAFALVAETETNVPTDVANPEPAVDVNGDDSIASKQIEADKTDLKSEPINVPQEPVKLSELSEAAQTSGQDDETKNKDHTGSGGVFLELNLKHKRLCERWLDNLFIVLYEDLRQYTVWRTEVQHYKVQQLEYNKNATEWEILGDLATRLCHEPEAKEAYRNCLKQRFSPRAWTRLLEIYADEGDVTNALQAAVKLTIYHNRWYNEMTNPTHIYLNVNKLIGRHGLSKVQNSLTSMNLTEPIQRMMNKYFENAVTFQVEGYDF